MPRLNYLIIILLVIKGLIKSHGVEKKHVDEHGDEIIDNVNVGQIEDSDIIIKLTINS